LTGLDISRLGKYLGKGAQVFSLGVDVRYDEGPSARLSHPLLYLITSKPLF
jgi:hypothetical protein